MIRTLLHEFSFWLIVVSLMVLAAERVRPWRKQRLLRPEIGQDLFWFTFNSFLTAFTLGWLFTASQEGLDWGAKATLGFYPSERMLLAGLPFWLQMASILLVSDFLEYIVHNGLHRIPGLWKFHRIHHSIHTMDWIGNLRFHWVEALVYTTIKYLPLAMLGGKPLAWLAVNVFSLTIGHLNHSNLNISWGPLGYILNSPRLHIWHHDRVPQGNYGVVLCLWDRIFRTVYLPAQPIQPESIGYVGDERLPNNILWRFAIPFLDSRRAKEI